MAVVVTAVIVTAVVEKVVLRTRLYLLKHLSD